MGSVDELEVTLRWDCLFFFIFAFWDAVRAITSQWCACVHADGERGVWRLA